jgi:hypothetical protein
MKSNKIYGNSQGDGFALYMGLITVLFVMGGIGLAKVGGIVLLAALPVFVVMIALMAMKLSKWDVMSDAVNAPMSEKKVDVKVTTFPVPGVSDSKPNPAAAAWSPSKDSAATLPASVEKPKSTVETNTHVA